MTRSDFLARRDAFEKEARRFALIWNGLFFSVLLACLPLAAWISEQKLGPWLPASFLLVFFGFLIGNAPLLKWIIKRQTSKCGLICANCGEPLTRGAGRITVATGKCGFCEADVFVDA
jgi:hypothetical protein